MIHSKSMPPLGAENRLLRSAKEVDHFLAHQSAVVGENPVVAASRFQAICAAHRVKAMMNEYAVMLSAISPQASRTRTPGVQRRQQLGVAAQLRERDAKVEEAMKQFNMARSKLELLSPKLLVW